MPYQSYIIVILAALCFILWIGGSATGSDILNQLHEAEAARDSLQALVADQSAAIDAMRLQINAQRDSVAVLDALLLAAENASHRARQDVLIYEGTNDSLVTYFNLRTPVLRAAAGRGSQN